MRYRLLVILVLLCSVARASYWNGHIIRHVGLSDGLTCNFVDDITEDQNHILWYALNGGGIAQYDGYNILTFDTSNSPELLSNFVHSLAVDAKGNMWIASDCGLNVMNTNTLQLTAVPLADGQEGEPLCGQFFDVVVDDAQRIWAISRHMLLVLATGEDGRATVIGQYKSEKALTALSCGSKGVYLASESEISVASIDSRDGRVRLRPLQSNVLSSGGNVVVSIAESAGFIWIGTNYGLYRHNMTTGEERVYRHNSRVAGSLSQDRITDIKIDNSGHLFVATLRGVNVYNHEFDNFDSITEENSPFGTSLCSNFVNCLLPTDCGLWIGTDVAGADIISPVPISVVNITTDQICNTSPLAQGAPSVLRPVNALAEDKEGGLWVGLVEGGLAYRAKGTETFQNITTASHRLSHNSVSSIEFDGNGRLWAGTWGGGVDLFDLSQRRAVLKTSYNIGNGLATNFIGTIKYDHINNGMWIASVGDISFVDSLGVLHHPIDPTAYADMNGAIGAAIDGVGRLWLGTSIALFVVDLNSYDNEKETVAYKTFRHRVGDPTTPGDPRITNIYYSPHRHRICISTNGDGLFSVDDRTPTDSLTFRNYTTANGLAHNCVIGMAEDEDNNLWLSTANGLSVIQWNGAIRSFTTADGLLSDAYYWNASLRSASGNVLFGSLAGLSELEPFRTSSSVSLSEPVLTRLDVNNTLVLPSEDGILTETIAKTNKIVIHEADKSFAVEFSALYYPSPSTVKYQYMLDGFDDAWVDVPRGSHSAQYTNLPSGDYVLRIRSAIIGQEWGDERQLAIHIVPLFYKTIWFLLLVLALICFGVWAMFKIRLRHVEANRLMLHSQVLQRTRELSEQKQILTEQKRQLEQQKNELEEKNERLLEQNRYITRQKENILDMTGKIQKLSIDKIQFFTNMSHELRSPLTLITGPVKRALALCEEPEVRKQLELIERSSASLLSTVNQLMDFRKVETGSLELHPVSTDIEKYIRSIVSTYAAYAEEQGIVINTFLHITEPYVRIDIDALSKIMANLLSNAIKYSDGGKRIDGYLCQLVRDGLPYSYICVRDRGRGIPEDQLDQIFDRFYQAGHTPTTPHGESTGIGLYVVNRIVIQFNGEIEARNNKNGGLSMRILLPMKPGKPDEIEPEETQAEPEEIEELEVEELEDDDADEKTNHSRLTILVVDDSHDMRVYIRSILEDKYRIVEAPNGVMGLAALAEHDVDFVIADLMMPVMDGMEFARKVKADFAFSHTPILILTAQMDGKYQTESYRMGVESYLHKPFDEEMLKARISGILNNVKSNQKRFLTTLDLSDLNIAHESDDERFVQRVTDFVKAKYRDPEFTIDDIVAEIGCSKSMLHKKMQSVMGQAPGAFIRTYRLSIARELLSTPSCSLNVSQVAYEVGFNDPKYFSRCFTKVFGYPPSKL